MPETKTRYALIGTNQAGAEVEVSRHDDHMMAALALAAHSDAKSLDDWPRYVHVRTVYEEVPAAESAPDGTVADAGPPTAPAEVVPPSGADSAAGETPVPPAPVPEIPPPPEMPPPVEIDWDSDKEEDEKGEEP